MPPRITDRYEEAAHATSAPTSVRKWFQVLDLARGATQRGAASMAGGNASQPQLEAAQIQNMSYCQWCRNKPGGCIYCPPKETIPETQRRELVTMLLGDAHIVAIRETRIIEIHRVPPPDEDRLLCEPDSQIARLFDERSQVERRVAMVKWSEEFARFQGYEESKNRKSVSRQNKKPAAKDGPPFKVRNQRKAFVELHAAVDDGHPTPKKKR